MSDSTPPGFDDMSSEPTAQTWQRMKTLAADALERPVDERDDFVSLACGSDAAMAAEVRSIVRAAALADRYLERPSGLITSTLVPAGARIDAWRLVRPLGQGGMASVYLAEREASGFVQRAAVKVVRGGFADGPLGQRFDDERRILASLEHPNIARFIDGGATTDGVPYVALEYVEGERIDEYCSSHGLGIRERVALFRQVCAAVEYAHRRLVVHRDIKASNILIAADGTPKLLDFGIAKLIDPEAVQRRTHTLLRVATPESASPEQLRGEPVSTATDIYSLGVLLYRLITNSSPYRGPVTTELDLVRAVCEETPVAPSRLMTEHSGSRIPWLRRRRSDDLDHILLKALRKEPERRYGTVEQFSEDLLRYLEGRPVKAAPDSRTYRTRRFLSRHRFAVAAAAVLAAAVAAGVAATAWQAGIARRERARAQAQFDAVRSLANAVLGDVSDAIARLPGSGPAQTVLLAHATTYLDTLASQATGDIALRVELARGFMRLGQIQGLPGMPNLGDQRSARQSYERAAALLEPLVSRSDDPVVSTSLAEVYSRIGTLTTDADEKMARYRAGLALVTNLPEDVKVLGTAQALWAEIGNLHVTAARFDEAEAASREAVALAQRAYALAPQDLNASRNLSLALKTEGALLDRRGFQDRALVEYHKARELDLARVERQPARGLWKLDLSFSNASIATALVNKGELNQAIESYREAMRLREEVVAADPADDFAALSLARGHRRMAELLAKVPDVEGMIAALESQLQILRQRREAHPERSHVWYEHAIAGFAAVRLSADVLDAHRDHPPSAASRVRAMLDDLRQTRARWAETNAGWLGEDDAAFGALEYRLRD